MPFNSCMQNCTGKLLSKNQVSICNPAGIFISIFNLAIQDDNDDDNAGDGDDKGDEDGDDVVDDEDATYYLPISLSMMPPSVQVRVSVFVAVSKRLCVV